MARPRRSEQLVEPDELACAVRMVHIDKVQAARRQLPRSGVVGGLSELFGALSDPTRLRIVAALAAQELCVCDLAATISISESAASHQLRHLRSIGLIRSRREGRLVYYSLDDEHVTAIFRQALEHVEHQDRAS
jgi:DNA-binding transcriptional ArsR family regulator